MCTNVRASVFMQECERSPEWGLGNCVFLSPLTRMSDGRQEPTPPTPLLPLLVCLQGEHISVLGQDIDV